MFELRALEILDAGPDAVMDTITALAADIMDVPITLVSLVDVNRQWFMSRVGLLAPETSRDVSFCGHVVAEGRSLVVVDTTADDRFADNPLVTGEPHIRFYAGFPLRTTTGFDLGTLCAIDRAPRQPSERQLSALSRLATLVVERIESKQRYALARRVVDHVPGMLAYWDSQQRCRFANAAYNDWFGISPEKLVGTTMKELLGPLYARNLPHIEGAFRGEVQSFEREIPRPDGAGSRASQAHYLPHVVNGAVLGFVVMVTDISKRKELEASLATTAREREVLLQEIHHRVKNNLQMISSLINMQVRNLEDPASIVALRECQNRVLAISLIHQQLYQAGDYARIPFSEYARTVVTSIFHAYDVQSNVALDLDIADIRLSVDKAIPCGLILNELITNALKHAFPDRRRGTLWVVMRGEPEGMVAMCVRDNGIGMPMVRTSTSLGMQLVRSLTEQLEGTLEQQDNGGTTFTIRFRTA
jgi:PAS domain S-box-containing protein